MKIATRTALLLGGLIGFSGAGLALLLVNYLGWQFGARVGLTIATIVGIFGGWILLRLANSYGPDPDHHLEDQFSGNPTLSDYYQFTANCEQALRAIYDLSDQLSAKLINIADGISQSTTLIGTVTTLCDRASQSADAASEADSLVQQQASLGRTSLAEVDRGMDRLHAFVESNGRKIRRHSDRSAEISAIVETIGEISQRTDMLAMNATIESVRAGEHGRGFARVAEEIRKLAERSADATREIGTLAEVIQAETLESMRGLEDQQNEVDLLVRRVHEVGGSLVRIEEESSRSGQHLESISSDTAEQAQAAQGLESFAHRIRANFQRTLEELKRLRDQAAALQRQAEQFLMSIPSATLEQRPGSSAVARQLDKRSSLFTPAE